MDSDDAYWNRVGSIACGIALGAVFVWCLVSLFLEDEHGHTSLENQYRSFMREQNDTLKEIRLELQKMNGTVPK